MTKVLLCLTLLFAIMSRLHADAPPTTINLWPHLAPGETTASTGDSSDDATGRYGTITKITDITSPQLFFYAGDGSKQARPTVVVFPGGGYYVVTADIEGAEIAHWLNSLGYNAAVLHYRVPNYKIPSPARREPAFQDAQRAVSLLRADAKTLGIDPHHLGVIGFSAGGHLAARLAASDGSRAYSPLDVSDKASDRPDFALLIYPAYLWDKTTNQSAPEVRPHAGMPPMFLVQTRDDELFDAEDYANTLKKAGVSATTEIYDKGGHGYGLRLAPDLPGHHWPEEAATWLKQQIGTDRAKL